MAIMLLYHGAVVSPDTLRLGVESHQPSRMPTLLVENADHSDIIQ